MDHIEGGQEDADIFASAVHLLCEGHVREAEEILSTLPATDPVAPPIFERSAAPPDLERAKAQTVTNATRAQIYKRDGWRCRYCRRKCIVPGILELLTIACPGFRGVRLGHHMPYAFTERAVERVYPNIDHIHPVSKGGAWLDEANHVTACTPCNTKKNDWLGWTPGPIVRDEWDGLISSYRDLTERVYSRKAYHLKWFRDLGI